jgi:hypothetical protein
MPAKEGVAKGSIFRFSTSEALMGRGQENSKDPLSTPSKAGIYFKHSNNFTMDCVIRHNDDIFFTLSALNLMTLGTLPYLREASPMFFIRSTYSL